MTAPPRAVVHFDIDGTLLRCGDVPRRALARALETTFGTAGAIADVRFGGKTDRLIVAEALPGAPGPGDARWNAFWEAYVAALDDGLAAAPPALLPAVLPLLTALRQANVALSLVTGNIAAGAEVKLRRGGLAGFFDPLPPTAAYATDGTTKAELGPVLRDRTARVYGPAVDGKLQVVVGDTASDVACARAAGFRAVAVATGPFSASELGSCRPDAVLASFAPTAGAIAALLGGSGA